MSPITALHISSVRSEISAGYIARVFDGCDIAKVGPIKFAPIFKNGKRIQEFKRATITINSWHESEVAYMFIKMLNKLESGAKVWYNRDNFWSVKVYKPKPLCERTHRFKVTFENCDDFDDVKTRCEECWETFAWTDLVQTDACALYFCRDCIKDKEYGFTCDDCDRQQKGYCVFVSEKKGANKNVTIRKHK